MCSRPSVAAIHFLRFLALALMAETGVAQTAAWQDPSKHQVPAAKIVYLVGANNYIFLTNEAEVVRETVAFIEGLK
jgi:hypothetical protein